ncbi:HAMP domain-containing histidine kinase [Novosphingobium guangzhouense]|uniref:histidine kinase n=1 Tax=Novosphingobium guangzhouense TaxID=1850347 RepID=A0A2K2G262_9SPHN|nr:HAMP domain-containing histidine kinase [Novosphingobium guangzhouense]PNU05126.1 histidine kinase [Novosphingobium guangzhouense]
MHFDDRLATVLRLPTSGDGLARIQFRQLVDILGRAPDVQEPSETVEAAFTRLEQLGRDIPAAERARLLRQPLQPITNPRLLSWLARAEPDVACAGIAAARLDDDAWLALIPRLPVRARGILRHRRDLSERVEVMLESLGVHDRGLPSGPSDPLPEDPLPDMPDGRFQRSTGNIAVDQDMSEDVLELLDMADNPPPPTSLSEWARARAAQQKDIQHKIAADASATAREAGIGAIVRRIEEFRKAREGKGPLEVRSDSPRLPLGDTTSPAPQRLAVAIDFTTNVEGRVDWADGPHAPSIVGLALIASGIACDGQAPDVAYTMQHHLPLRAARIVVEGAPAVSGPWQVDAAARFSHGRFAGYCGRLRRVAPPAEVAASPPAARHAEADRMREVLHELRTPANAIQVAAEIIQQQLYGPAPHEYRALAAAIAGDCAHILAGFEELDRLVKLESGAMTLEDGECDLARILTQTIVRLRAWTEPRGSGFSMVADPAATSLPVHTARPEIERLVWRLFAALAGSTAPGEILDLQWHQRPGARGMMTELVVQLPSILAERPPEALFDAVAGERGQSLAAGMFGIGFTLRLAAAEAAATGGTLQRVANHLCLSLPALTGSTATGMNANDSNSATFSQ